MRSDRAALLLIILGILVFLAAIFLVIDDAGRTAAAIDEARVLRDQKFELMREVAELREARVMPAPDLTAIDRRIAAARSECLSFTRAVCEMLGSDIDDLDARIAALETTAGPAIRRTKGGAE